MTKTQPYWTLFHASSIKPAGLRKEKFCFSALIQNWTLFSTTALTYPNIKKSLQGDGSDWSKACERDVAVCFIWDVRCSSNSGELWWFACVQHHCTITPLEGWGRPLEPTRTNSCCLPEWTPGSTALRALLQMSEFICIKLRVSRIWIASPQTSNLIHAQGLHAHRERQTGCLYSGNSCEGDWHSLLSKTEHSSGLRLCAQPSTKWV